MQNSVKKCRIPSWFDGQEKVACPCDRRNARIDDDDFRPELTRLPYIAGRDRCALGDIRATDPNHARLRNIRPWIRGPIDAKRLLVTGRGAYHAKATVIVNIGSLQADARKL